MLDYVVDGFWYYCFWIFIFFGCGFYQFDGGEGEDYFLYQYQCWQEVVWEEVVVIGDQMEVGGIVVQWFI